MRVYAVHRYNKVFVYLTRVVADNEHSGQGTRYEQRQPEQTTDFTMAPNVGLPSSVQKECCLRRDTGYVLLDLPTDSQLSTPDDFCLSVPDQIRPVRDVGSEFDRGSLAGIRSPRNVTFRGVRRKWYRDTRDISPSSVESGGESSGGSGDECRRPQRRGGSRGWTREHV